MGGALGAIFGRFAKIAVLSIGWKALRGTCISTQKEAIARACTTGTREKKTGHVSALFSQRSRGKAAEAEA